MAAKVLELTFRGKDESVIATMKKMGSEADSVSRKMKEMGQAQEQSQGGSAKGGGLHGLVKNLRGNLGGRSDLAQLGKIAVGGGAIAGLTVMASALGTAAENAKKLVDQFKAGEASSGQMVAGIVSGIPIIGQFYEAGSKVKDLLASFSGLSNSWFGRLTGLNELHDAEEINKQEAARKVLLDAVSESLDRQKKSMREIADLSRQLTARKERAGLEGFAAADFDQKQKSSDRMHELQQKRRGELDEQEKARKAAIEKLADMAPDVRQSEEVKINEQSRKEIAQINQRWNAVDAQERDTDAEEYAAWLRHEQEEAGKAVGDQLREIGTIKAQGQADQLKSLGRDLEAELFLIDQNTQQKKQAIDDALRERLKNTDPQMAENVKVAAQMQKDAIDQSALQQKQGLAYKTVLDGQFQVLQAQAQAGDDLAAKELARLQMARDYQLLSAKLLAISKEQTATDEQRKAALADVAALQSAITGSVDKDLRDQRKSVLQQRVEFGIGSDRTNARKELTRQDLTEAFNKQQATTLSILNDPNATDAQKQAAKDNLRQFAATIGKEYDKDVYGQNTPQKFTANLEERGLLLTGVAAAAKERHDPQDKVAANTAEANNLQRQLLAKFDQLLHGGGKGLQIVVGVSDGNQG